jgi:uncharacterized membrane protein YhaH (DUF805 family)
MFSLSFFLLSMLFVTVFRFLGFMMPPIEPIGQAFNAALTLLFLIPLFSMKVRRFHDVGKGVSGWWLVALIILMFIFFVVIALMFFAAMFSEHLPAWYLPLIYIVLILAFTPFLLVLVIESLKGSPTSNRFGSPADDSKPSDYKFVFTSKLKKCLVAFIIFFMGFLIIDWALDAYKKAATEAGKNRGLTMSQQTSYTHGIKN